MAWLRPAVPVWHYLGVYQNRHAYGVIWVLRGSLRVQTYVRSWSDACYRWGCVGPMNCEDWAILPLSCILRRYDMNVWQVEWEESFEKPDQLGWRSCNFGESVILQALWSSRRCSWFSGWIHICLLPPGPTVFACNTSPGEMVLMYTSDSDVKCYFAGKG
jgi:hypothetical protein